MNRYSRQLPIIEAHGQESLSNAIVLVVGAGGIGSPVLTYLAAAGVGKIVLVDKDKVELSNLHRQTLFNENDIGSYKANCAYNHLKQINSAIAIEAYANELDTDLAQRLISVVDLVIDGTDNYESRYLINDACVFNKKPFISCSILQEIVQVVFFDTTKICYRCVYPKEPPAGMILNCEESGVLGTVTGIAGTLTANLAIHYLVQREKSADPILRIFNATDFSLDSLKLIPDQNCMVCKQQNTKTIILKNNIIKLGVSLNNINRHEYFLVDIRDQTERDAGKLDDDLFFPIKNEFNYEFFLNYKEKKILIYCATGYRSQLFVTELREKGVEAYYLLNGVSIP